MSDINLEYYLGLAGIVASEIYSSGKRNQIINTNNVLKGGKRLGGIGKSLGKGAKFVGKGAKGLVTNKPLSPGAKNKLTELEDKQSAEKALKDKTKYRDAAKNAANKASKNLSEGVQGTFGFIERNFSPMGLIKVGLIIAIVMFLIFMGAPSFFIIILLVFSWQFLKNQINRYFPSQKSNPKLSNNTNNNTNSNNNNNNNL